MNISKITQPQLRVLRHKLECMASAARHKARSDYEQHSKEIERASLAICNRVLNKHRKALAAELVPDVGTWRGISVHLKTPDDNTAALRAYQADCKAAIKKAGLDGITDETVYVCIASLGLTGEGRRGDCLSVPQPQKAKWEQLANEIDMAFMSGDAAKLLHIIETFNVEG